ncbi:50S ribosomal protein L22 [bacterium]|nr:50S ribosomal protein L22 [bacterium]
MDKTVKIQIKNIPVSPYKTRLVADLVRNMEVEKALDTLNFLNKKAAVHMKKALVSAIASAKQILGVEAKGLKIAKLTVGEGVKRPGVRFESRGRATRLITRRSHINLELKAK